jgi:hypothetical protein
LISHVNQIFPTAISQGLTSIRKEISSRLWWSITLPAVLFLLFNGRKRKKEYVKKDQMKRHMIEFWIKSVYLVRLIDSPSPLEGRDKEISEKT